MLIIKLLSLAIFVGCWTISRRGNRLTIVDVLLLALLLIQAPYFLFNPTARSDWNFISFSDTAVLSAEIAVSLMYSTVGIALLSGRVFLPWPKYISVVQEDRRSVVSLSNKFTLISLALVLILTLLPGFVSYRTATFQFLFGSLETDEYTAARRLLFNGTAAFETINRLRFTLLPIALLIIASRWIDPFRVFFVGLASLVFFLILPMSLSKLPFVYYVGYVVIFYLHYHGRLQNFSLLRLASLAFVAVLCVIAVMSPLYMLQYNNISGFQNVFEKPIALAFERIWGENYSIILRYFTVYPDVLPYTGLSSINLLSGLSGLPYRNPDLEVPFYFFGSDVLTTNPGVFMLSGYASFGYFGVLIYTLVAIWFVMFLDWLHTRIRSNTLSSIYFAVLGVNVTFIAQLALPAALLTYGVAIVPIGILLLDRMTFRKSKRLDQADGSRAMGIQGSRPMSDSPTNIVS